jgi:hypothetical protein
LRFAVVVFAVEVRVSEVDFAVVVFVGVEVVEDCWVDRESESVKSFFDYRNV